MTTELRATFRSGFFLNEAELIRLKDELNEQFRKVSPENHPDFSFRVRFRNGAVTTFSTLQEVMQLENFGSGLVTSLWIIVGNAQNSQFSAEVKFTGAVFDDGEQPGISYKVSSTDKDWAFVTSSKIDERLKKIKLSKIFDYIVDGRPMLLLAVALSLALIFVSYSLDGNAPTKAEKLTQIYNTYKDTNTLIYKISMIDYEKSRPGSPLVKYLLLTTLMFAFVSSILPAILKKASLSTFYWGDNIARFDRRMSMSKIVFVGVVLSFAVGLAVNFASSKFF